MYLDVASLENKASIATLRPPLVINWPVPLRPQAMKREGCAAAAAAAMTTAGSSRPYIYI
jgi:hypothetical protein